MVASKRARPTLSMLYVYCRFEAAVDEVPWSGVSAKICMDAPVSLVSASLASVVFVYLIPFGMIQNSNIE